MKILSSTRFTISGFILFVIALFLYSFTQIDLSLTLSQASLLQEIQKSFQYVGYFTRPISTQLYIMLILGLFFFYIRILDGVRKKSITAKHLLLLTGISTFFLMSSYNAFSYDLFNYIFDAKIITYYQENPYMKKALDFPADPMLSFMRWTHRTYPYGPLWLVLSVPVSFAGMQIFTVTLVLFKMLMALSFVGTSFLVYKIMQKVSPMHATLAAAFFALNPLVLIESLVSAHNDIVMMFFAVASIYVLVKKHLMPAILLLLISIGIKFVTILMVPVFVYVAYLMFRKKQPDWEKMFVWMFTLMIFGVVAATIRTNFQPWYLLYLIPFGALLSYRKYFFTPLILLSVAGLFNYVPYLFSGNWDPPIPIILNNLNITSAVVACLLCIIIMKQERRLRK